MNEWITDLGALAALEYGAEKEYDLAGYFERPRSEVHSRYLICEMDHLVSRDRQRPLTWRMTAEGRERLALLRSQLRVTAPRGGRV